MHSRQRWHVHADVAATVDALLRGQPARPQVRELADDGRLLVQDAPPPQLRALQNPRGTPPLRPSPPSLVAVPLPVPEPLPGPLDPSPVDPLRVYGAGIGRGQLEQVVRARQLPVQVMGSVELADVVLSVRQQLGRDPHVRRQAQELGLPILVIKSAALPQLQRALERLLQRHRPVPLPGADAGGVAPDDALAALEECRLAVEQVVLAQGQPVELLPRSEAVRQQQAELAACYSLRTAVFGHGEQQRLRVFPA
jgi:hypothetical protein